MRAWIAAAAFLYMAARASAGPVPPVGCPNCILNSAAPQNAQINIGTATIRGMLDVSTATITYATLTNVTITNLAGNGSSLTALNASQLTSGTVPSARVSGAYGGITGVGTLASGTWQSTPIGTQYGGTGQNWSAVGANNLPYFTGTGAMGTLAPATGVLQFTGSALGYTQAPALAGTNFTSIPLTALSAGTLSTSITVTDGSLVTVSGTKVTGNISGGADFLTTPLPLSNLGSGTLSTSIVASSITATGVTPGTYGGPSLIGAFTVRADGRLSAAAQYPFVVAPSSITPGALPLSVTVSPAQLTAGTDPFAFASVSSVTASAFFGDGSHLTGLTATTIPNTISSSFTVTNASGILAPLFTATGSPGFSGNGAGLTGVPQSAVTGLSAQLTAVAASTTTLASNVATLFSAVNSTGSALTLETARALAAENVLSVSTHSLAVSQLNYLPLAGGAMTGAITMTGASSSITTASSVTASAFFGDGSHLSGVVSSVGNLTGPVTSVGLATSIPGPVPQSAVNLSTVTLALNNLSALFVTNASSMTNTSPQGILVTSSVTAGAFYGDGSHLSGVGASPNWTSITGFPAACGLPFVVGSVGPALGCVQPSNVTGNAATATAFSVAPSTCTLPQVAKGVDTGGNAICAEPSDTSGNAATATLAAAVASGGVDFSTITARFNTVLPLAGGAMTGAITMTGASSSLTTASSVTASAFFGDASHLSNLPPVGISTGVVTTAALTGNGNSSSPIGVNSSSVPVFNALGGYPAASGAAITAITAANISAGSLGPSVIASSIAVNSISNAQILAGTFSSIDIPAANVNAGTLGASVIASSVAASGVTTGTYGDSSHVGSFTVGVDGRLSAASSVAITAAPSGAAGGDLTGTYPNPRVGSLETVAISLPFGGTPGALVGLFTDGSNGAQTPAFDGTNVWSLDPASNPAVFTKWSTAGVPTNFTFGSLAGRPSGMAFDGTNLWAGGLTGTPAIYKIALSGTITRFATGITNNSNAVAVDSSGNIWTTSQGTFCVMSEISPSGVQISSVAVDVSGFQCQGIAYDGTNMWTTSAAGNKTYKVSPSFGVTTYTPTTGGGTGLAFDGTNIWITGAGSMVVINTSGVTQHTFTVGSSPYGAVWDGTHMWARELASTNLYRVSTTGTVNTYTTGNSGALGVSEAAGVFDGANIWWGTASNNGINEVQAVSVPVSPSPGMVLVDTGSYAAVWQRVQVSTADITPGFNGASELVQMTAATELPAVDGSLLTNIKFTGAAGADLTGNYPNPTVAAIGGVAVSTAAGGAVGTLVAAYAGPAAGPVAVAFDGVNMWTANFTGSAGAFSRYSSTGTRTDFASGHATAPSGMAADGLGNVWASDSGGNFVYKITRSGTITAFATTHHSNSIAFDGTNMWTVDGSGSGTVAVINPSGTETHVYPVSNSGDGTNKIVFDGTNMWTTSQTGTATYKIAPNGVVSTFTVVTDANDMAFDGTNLWFVAGSGTVLVVSTSAATLHTYSVGSTPEGLVWDGSHMWLHEFNSTTLYRVAPDGTTNTYTGVGSAGTAGNGYPFAGFDGANLWIASQNTPTGLREVVAYQAFYPPSNGMQLTAVNGAVAQWKAPIPRAQTDKTSTRALGLVYQNTGTSPLWVNVVVNCAVGGDSITAATDSSSSPSTVVSNFTNSITGTGSVTSTVSFIVMPGNYYELTGTGTASISGKWTEWQ